MHKRADFRLSTADRLTTTCADLEWKLTYVGSATSAEHDQELDSLFVGPIPIGVNKFIMDDDVHEMVRGIRGYRLLEGYRGHAPADVAAIEQVLLRISRMVEEIPEIKELDLNPIFALPPGQGCAVVDVRIRVAR